MRFMIVSLCLFVTLMVAPPSMAWAQTLGWTADVGSLIDQYIDQRYEGDRADTDLLLEGMKAAGVTRPQDLEQALRHSRASYPDAAKLLGQTTVHTVECQHVDYSSRYFMYVSAELDLASPVALVIVGHGGNSSMSPQRAEATAKAYLSAYQPVANSLNAILVAPASCRGWGQIGNSLMLSTVSKIQRTIPVDSDRIYLTGQSMGGHLSYRSALSLPDRFGAVSPHSGGYDFVAKQSIGNLINVPGYAVWGVREPYGINKDNRTNQAWAESHGLEWKFVEKNGGHEIYQDELGKVASFFADRPRDLYRKKVYLRSGGAMKFVKTWGIKGWPTHTVLSKTKPLRWNMRHWLEVQPRPDHAEPLTIMAVNRGENKIDITSSNVRELSIFLHPRMVDLEKPVVITINGEQQYNARVEIDPRLMFELAREFDDRGRVFWAKVDLEVSTDRDVVISSQ
ncbi:MAG: hypothetical protein ACI87E_002670 [Mariniblastus sp.]|jgi:hypothetical protein